MGLLLLFNMVARIVVVKANFKNTHVNIPRQVETRRQGHSSKMKECCRQQRVRGIKGIPPSSSLAEEAQFTSTAPWPLASAIKTLHPTSASFNCCLHTLRAVFVLVYLGTFDRLSSQAGRGKQIQVNKFILTDSKCSYCIAPVGRHVDSGGYAI